METKIVKEAAWSDRETTGWSEGAHDVFKGCMHAQFTWLWSFPQFCTRNRESVQRGQRGKRSLAKGEQMQGIS